MGSADGAAADALLEVGARAGGVAEEVLGDALEQTADRAPRTVLGLGVIRLGGAIPEGGDGGIG